MTLTILKNTGQAFWRMTLNWGLSDVFLMIRLGLYVLERRPKGEMPSHHIVLGAHACQHGPSLKMLALITHLRLCLPGFSTVVAIFHPPCPNLWKRVTKSVSHFRRQIKLPLLEVKGSTYSIWNYSVRGADLSLLPIYLFHHFTVIIIDSIFHFILWVIFQYGHYLFCCSLYFPPAPDLRNWGLGFSHWPR